MYLVELLKSYDITDRCSEAVMSMVDVVGFIVNIFLKNNYVLVL